MRYLAFLPVSITLYLVVRTIMAKSARRSPEWQKNRVYLPNLLFWVGLLGDLFIIPSVILLWQENLLGVAYIALSLMGWSMQLAYANCWVRFGEQGFTHHTFFGRSYEFTYNEVTGIRWGGSGDVRLYCGKHLIFLDSMAVNANRFLKWTRKRSKQMELLPDRIQWDPYGHNVSRGKLNFFAYLIPCVLFGGIVIFAGFAIFGPPDSEETTVRSEVVFQAWEEDNGDYRLTGEDGTVYGITLYEDLAVDPKALCDGKTVYTVWAGDKATHWIQQLKGPEGMVFTFAEKQEAYKNDQLWAFVLLVLIWLLTLLSFLFSLRVGRNPDRFRPWIRRLFFRDL